MMGEINDDRSERQYEIPMNVDSPENIIVKKSVISMNSRIGRLSNDLMKSRTNANINQNYFQSLFSLNYKSELSSQYNDGKSSAYSKYDQKNQPIKLQLLKILENDWKDYSMRYL